MGRGVLWYVGNVAMKPSATPSIVVLRRTWMAWTTAALSATGCAGSTDLPPQIYQDGSTITGGGPWPEASVTDDAADVGPPDAGVLGPSSLFRKCYSDVMMQNEGTVQADPYFCYATTPGNPAENSTARNFLPPAVNVTLQIDDADRVFEAHASAYWAVVVTAPDGQMLTAGTTYSTANNDGTAISFRWDKGDCGTLPESGAFAFHVLTWDATNAVTTAALDFSDQCGDLAPLYGRVRLHSQLPP